MSSATVALPTVSSQPDNRRWIALAVIVAAQFMVVLDVAIVNVALPSIKTDLSFSEENLQWVVTAYAIMFGGALLLGGRMSDLLGRRRLFMAGLALFTVSSLLDGLAWSSGSLIAFRALQGLGAALLSPAALSILTTTFREGRERNVALGVWGAASGSGGAAGVLLGGALTGSLGWSWIFFINIPVGIAALRGQPVAAAREPGRSRPPAFRCARRGLDHRRADAARLRTDSGDAGRVGDGLDDRTPGRIRRSDRSVLRDRAALEGAATPAAALPTADAGRIQRDPATRRGRAFLAVLPADAVHAAGPALLGDADGRRVHRASRWRSSSSRTWRRRSSRGLASAGSFRLA